MYRLSSTQYKDRSIDVIIVVAKLWLFSYDVMEIFKYIPNRYDVREQDDVANEEDEPEPTESLQG